MNLKDILIEEGYKKEVPFLSYKVNNANGWFEKLVLFDNYSLEVGIAVDENYNCEVYISSLDCVVGCCGSELYKGKYNKKIINNLIQEEIEYWLKENNHDK